MTAKSNTFALLVALLFTLLAAQAENVVQVLRNLATNKGVQPLNAGQLQIQSEGAEAYYWRIEICTLLSRLKTQ